jgi:hypothetical protein
MKKIRNPNIVMPEADPPPALGEARLWRLAESTKQISIFK